MVVRILLIVVAVFLAYQEMIRAFRKLFDFPAPAFMGCLLDSGARRMLQPPDRMMERSVVRPGMSVLELGCGGGAFTTFVARAVGKTGKVYAVDIGPKMVKQLENKLSKPEHIDIGNVELILAGAYKLPFDDDFFDLAFMVTVLQEIPDRIRAIQEIRRVLRPAGILGVTGFLPDPDYPLNSTTVKMVRKAGFVLHQTSGSF